jgi:site-specific DNA-cytosine methylase
VTYGSLFSGIGGLDLALEAFGHTLIWQAESDPYARAVLAKHWPEIHCYRDVREIDEQAERPDIICGGFPCQDISNAGKRAGIGGTKSGLWSEFARIIRTLRPRFVFVENVAALTVRGLDRVLGDLASLGFDAEWDVLRAADVGAPHVRARIFILAYTQRADLWEQQGRLGGAGWPGEAQPGEHGESGPLADAIGAARGDGSEIARVRDEAEGRDGGRLHESGGRREDVADTWSGGQRNDAKTLLARQSESDGGGVAANPDGWRREIERRPEYDGEESWLEDARGDVADRCGSPGALADARGETGRPTPRLSFVGDRPSTTRQRTQQPGRRPGGDGGHWATEPDVGRVAHGVPKRVDRLRCLGNAVVWQQAALAWEALSGRIAESARR